MHHSFLQSFSCAQAHTQGWRPSLPAQLQANMNGPVGVPTEVSDTLQACWHAEAKNRPPFSEVSLQLRSWEKRQDRHHSSNTLNPVAEGEVEVENDDEEGEDDDDKDDSFVEGVGGGRLTSVNHRPGAGTEHSSNAII